MRKILINLLAGVALCACNASSTPSQPVSPTSTEEITGEETKQVVVLAPTTKPIEATQKPTETYGCDNPTLTPEEVANCGQHTYSVEGNQTAGDCYYKLDDGSRVQSYTAVTIYTNIFESGTVRTISENGDAVSIKIAPNIYELNEDDTTTLTTFTLDGWVDEFTWDDCKDTEKATLIN